MYFCIRGDQWKFPHISYHRALSPLLSITPSRSDRKTLAIAAITRFWGARKYFANVFPISSCIDPHAHKESYTLQVEMRCPRGFAGLTGSRCRMPTISLCVYPTTTNTTRGLARNMLKHVETYPAFGNIVVLRRGFCAIARVTLITHAYGNCFGHLIK